MCRYIISSFIAFVMVASFMLFWSPPAESGVAGLILDEACPPEAICACAGKLTGYMRNVKCDCRCECLPEPHRVCEPDRCSRHETPLVLQPWTGEGAIVCAVESCEFQCESD